MQFRQLREFSCLDRSIHPNTFILHQKYHDSNGLTSLVEKLHSRLTKFWRSTMDNKLLQQAATNKNKLPLIFLSHGGGRKHALKSNILIIKSQKWMLCKYVASDYTRDYRKVAVAAGSLKVELTGVWTDIFPTQGRSTTKHVFTITTTSVHHQDNPAQLLRNSLTRPDNSAQCKTFTHLCSSSISAVLILCLDSSEYLSIVGLRFQSALFRSLKLNFTHSTTQ